MPTAAKSIKREVKLKFPVKGVWRRLSYDEQPQEYAADAINVFPDDTITNRERGGSRPGINDLGSITGPVRAIGHMNWSNSGTYTTYLYASGGGALQYSANQGTSWTSAGTGLYSDRPTILAAHLQCVYAPVTSSPYLKMWDPGFSSGTGRYIDATPGASFSGKIATPATYTTGTITLVDGSTTVTGSGTTFPEWAESGFLYLNDDNGVQTATYTVAVKGSSTLLVLDAPFTVGRLTFASLSGRSYTLALMPNPAKCTLACTWHDRVILAGDKDNPNLFYGSRIGDGRDWFLGDPTNPSDKLAGFACNSIPGAGAVGDPITSLIPMDDDRLYIGTTYGLSLLRGDPLDGGILSTVSSSIGPLGQSSWCKIPHQSGDWLAFLSKQGLYVLPPNGRPMPVSSHVIPAELTGLDPSTYETAVGYDIHYRTLILSVSPRSGTSGVVTYAVKMDTVSGGGGTQDITNGSFWPQQFPSTSYQPFAMYNNPTFVQVSGDEGSLMMGGKDGVFRTFKGSQGQDSSSNDVSSFVLFGPFALADPGYLGILHTLEIVLADGSDPMLLDVQVGNSAEEAFNASAFNPIPDVSYTAYAIPNDSTNYTLRIRARGSHACLKFYSLPNKRWSLEEVTAWMMPAGKRRLG